MAGKRDARALVERVEPLSNESPLRITLMQGIARGEKMDLILQKATELGVAAIVPVIAERTEVKLDAARTEKRVAHWRSVVVSACEQSGRARLPSVATPLGLQDAAQASDTHALRLTLDPQGEHRWARWHRASRNTLSWRSGRKAAGRHAIAPPSPRPVSAACS